MTRSALCLILLLVIACAGAHAYSRSKPIMPRLVKPRPTPPPPAEVVFLLHGLGKSRLDMVPMSRAFRREGYEVVNWGYPSTKYPIEKLAEMLAEQVAKHPNQRVHFVTHSMGGIIVRQFLSKHKVAHQGRLVMVAPPNQGAWIADQLHNWFIFKALFGPAGGQLGAETATICAKAGTPNCEFGIIAGGRGCTPGMMWFIPGDNDGTISVECTRLEGAADFLLLPYPHVTIHMMPRTVRNAVNFIRTGKFLDSEAKPPTKKKGHSDRAESAVSLKGETGD